MEVDEANSMKLDGYQSRINLITLAELKKTVGH